MAVQPPVRSLVASAPRKSVAGRAVFSLALYLGFYMVGWLAIAALLAINLALLVFADRVYPILLIATAIAAFGVLRGSLAVFRKGKYEEPGVPVMRHTETKMYAFVDEVARQAGVEPPQEIRYDSEVNAAVYEVGGLFGARRRVMLIGVPLVNSLTIAEFAGVIAHELGHYSGGHTALGGLTYRLSDSVRRTIGHVDGGLLGGLLTAYATFYFRVSLRVKREQEIEADVVASNLVGSEIFARALRKVDFSAVAFSTLLNDYAKVAMAAGVSPSDLFDGHRKLLRSRGRRQAFVDIARQIGDAEAGEYASHPSTAARVALLKHAPVPAAFTDDRPAASLFTAPAAMEQHMALLFFREVTETEPQASEPLEVALPKALSRFMRSSAVRTFGTLGRLDPPAATLKNLVDLLAHQGVVQLTIAEHGPIEHVPVDERLAQCAEYTRPLVEDVVHAALLDHGARLALNWDGPIRLLGANDVEIPVLDAVAKAVLGDVAPLLDVMRSQGVNPSWAPTPAPTQSAPGPQTHHSAPIGQSAAPGGSPQGRVLAVLPFVSNGKSVYTATRLYDLLLTDDLLVAVPIKQFSKDVVAVNTKVNFGGSGDDIAGVHVERLQRLTAQPFEAILHKKGVKAIPLAAISAAEMKHVDSHMWKLKVQADRTYNFQASQNWAMNGVVVAETLLPFVGQRLTVR